MSPINARDVLWKKGTIKVFPPINETASTNKCTNGNQDQPINEVNSTNNQPLVPQNGLPIMGRTPQNRLKYTGVHQQGYTSNDYMYVSLAVQWMGVLVPRIVVSTTRRHTTTRTGGDHVGFKRNVED